MKKALVLGVGGAKGLAHIGVLQALEEIGWKPDLIVGASMGAVVGGMYCAGLTVDQLKAETSKWNQLKFIMLGSPTISRRGLLSGRGLIKEMRRLTGDPQIEDLKIPFAVVATDSKTGFKVVITKGDLAGAVAGSVGILGVFMPQPWNGMSLVDGGLSEPAPVKTARELGADYVLAVDVLGSLPRRFSGDSQLHEVFLKSVAVYQRALVREALGYADAVIQPDMSAFAWNEFQKGKAAIARGYETAQEAIREYGLAALAGP